jgi:hypothetical protein
MEERGNRILGMDREKMRLLFSLEVVCWVAMFSTGEEGPEDGRGMESRDGLVSKQAQTPSSFSSFFLSHDQKG